MVCESGSGLKAQGSKLGLKAQGSSKTLERGLEALA
jgi:hypothetical protein